MCLKGVCEGFRDCYLSWVLNFVWTVTKANERRELTKIKKHVKAQKSEDTWCVQEL